MSKPILKLHTEFNRELQAIRSSIRKHIETNANPGAGPPMDLIEQGERLLTRLEEWLLDDEQKQALTDNEWHLFFLHAAVYLCDIAVTINPDQRADGPIARQSHDGIKASWSALGIKDEIHAEILARICSQMAWATNAGAQKSQPAGSAIEDTPIDIGFLATCVVLSKALELKALTTLRDIAAYLPADASDLEHRLTEIFDVIRVGPHPYFPATIQVKISCRHGEVHRALKHHERQVQELLHRLNQRIRPRFLFSDLIYEIEPFGYQPVDLKFTVDSSAALQLFMGHRLYSDKRVFLRELIQNAIDACSLRRLSDASYSPQIGITFNEDISVITVQDNGIGMDRQWVEKYFLSIGISFYKSDRIRDINRDAHIDIGFISQFGIGFLSSFLVAEKIVIKTRKAGAQGLKITITGLKDYFDVRPLDDDQPTGTQVLLYLKKSKINLCRSLEYAGYLKTNIRFLQAPVRFTDERGKTTTIGQAPLSYAAVKTAATDFSTALGFESSEGYLYLGTKMHTDHIFALETAKGGVSLFQDGIFITHEETLLPEGARQHVVGRINLRGADKCELSMDRNRIFWTSDQKNHIRRLIRHGLADLANHVMNAMDGQGVTGNTHNSVVNHLAIFFNFSDVDDVMHQTLAQPIRRLVEKRFKDFIRIHFAHTLRAEGIPEADGYNERWQQNILSSFVHKN